MYKCVCGKSHKTEKEVKKCIKEREKKNKDGYSALADFIIKGK